jgi:hypothetical protein
MARPRLFHVSEDAGIARFAPRPVPSPDSGVTGEAVWAVAESHLANFLTPRDCPRITFRAGAKTTEDDKARFLSGARQVVAFEASWLERVSACTLAIYEMPPEPFELALPEAGYWISREAVEPLSEMTQGNLLAALTAAGAEVRVLQEFWPLCNAVASSSLEFSILRARNAAARSRSR